MKFKYYILITLIIILILVSIFAYRNMSYDIKNERFLEKKGYNLGFLEYIVILDDGSEIYYIEGPKNGPALLLLHGQQVDCFDYAKVLPELSKEFHIFALDYYGHGKSSKNPNKYNIVDIGNDIIWFIKNVINEKIYISGHSSGALITSYVCANAPEYISACVLEDGPFFSTLPNKAEKTFAWLGFKDMYDYLNQDEIDTFMKYSLEHNYLKEFFNSEKSNTWDKVIKDPALKYLENHPNDIPKIWYYPPELGINSIYALNANMQDKTGQYDLRFGVTFYDFSWFKGFNQEETLKKIKAFTIVMHVAPNEITTPSYYDKNGILISAMDKKDAKKVVDLIPNAKYVGGFKSDHDIHADLPDEYIDVLLDLKDELEH